MKKYLLVVALFIPLLASAKELQDVIGTVGEIIGLVTPIVVALALLYFFWGLAQFILKSGDSGAQDEGKSKMIWGIIALFVMVSVWGIVSLVSNTLLGGDADSFGAPNIDAILPQSSSNNPLGG